MLIPDAGAFSAYSSDPSNPAEGLSNPAFFSTVAFFLMAMSLLCFIFMLSALRINIAFCCAFAGLIPSCKLAHILGLMMTLISLVDLLAASYWAISHGNAAYALTLQHGAAGCLLAVSFLGWYILAALILPTVDFPIVLPLGDLSSRIKGASERGRHQSPDSAEV